MRPRIGGAPVTVLLAAIVIACGRDDSDIVRGRGMTIPALSAVDQARVYEAAARASFSVDDPGLSLLLDKRMLPRTVGLTPAGAIADAVAAELRRRAVVRGQCEPPLRGKPGTAHCTAELPGYVLRFSPVFAIRPDSLQVYMYVQKYDTPASGISETLRFERAYQVVKRGTEWRAVREGRVPKEIRGEPK